MILEWPQFRRRRYMDLCFEGRIPAKIEDGCGLYPYRAQVLLKYTAMMPLDGNPPVVFSLLKFYPMAFPVTIDEPVGNHFRLPNLNYLRDVPIDEKHEIILPLGPIPHQLWPENPGDDGMVAYHSDYAQLVKPLSRIVPP